MSEDIVVLKKCPFTKNANHDDKCILCHGKGEYEYTIRGRCEHGMINGKCEQCDIIDLEIENTKYRKALEEIKKGQIDWTVKERLTMSRGEIFQEIAKEALK